MRGIDGFKTAEVAREYLTLEEVKKLAATPCNYPILKATFLFSCLTGLRKSDIEKLTWGEIHKLGNFTRIIFRQKKTGGQEYLDISDQAAAYLGTRRNDVDRVFEGFTYGSWTSLELKRWALAAGITKNITFHCGRHTFAVMMLDLGADIYTVSKLLGHRELSTTQIYAKVLDKNKQAAVSLIPNINEWQTFHIMASRQEAVLSLVKFNKFFKDLTYNICISGNAQLSTYVDELLNFEQWAYDVKECATECADPIFFSKINMLGSPEMLENYLKDGKGIIPTNNFDALFKVVNSVKELLQLVEEENEKARGEYANLVEEFAFENAAGLFDRAVKAGYLTTEYQPRATPVSMP